MIAPAWAGALVDLSPRAACMGYQNACVCERCADRSLRTAVFLGEERPHAETDAKTESEEYFARPWTFFRDPARPGEPPRPLRELA